MVEVAYIEYKINDYQYKVRIPKYYQVQSSPIAISTEELPTAYVCTTPGCRPLYNIGDTVWVSYEQGNIGIPVIIGQLFKQETGGSWLTLTENVELPVQSQKDYENHFQTIDQRINDVQNGNFDINKFSNSGLAGVSIENQHVKYIPRLIFNKELYSIEEALKYIINIIFNQYQNEENTLFSGVIQINQIGIINLTINKTKINKKNQFTDLRTVPEYCTGNFQLMDKQYLFGYNNSVWYFKQEVGN